MSKKILLVILVSLSFSVMAGGKNSSTRVKAEAGTFNASEYCFYAHEIYSEGSIVKQEGTKMSCQIPKEAEKGRRTIWLPLKA